MPGGKPATALGALCLACYGGSQKGAGWQCSIAVLGVLAMVINVIPPESATAV